ncbi:MAG: DUF2784 domain-containing protein [Woeseiaceae bacterium]|nr:DUF2784 domain-containing protein [Woeseiaceae bacterium]
MTTRLAADFVVLVHFGFVLFVAFGGFLVLRWPRLAVVHLPAVAWGVVVEITGRYCPLTGLENELRRAAGDAGYTGGFIEQYIVPILYPPGLTRNLQLALAGLLILVNLAVYGRLLWRRQR